MSGFSYLSLCFFACQPFNPSVNFHFFSFLLQYFIPSFPWTSLELWGYFRRSSYILVIGSFKFVIITWSSGFEKSSSRCHQNLGRGIEMVCINAVITQRVTRGSTFMNHLCNLVSCNLSTVFQSCTFCSVCLTLIKLKTGIHYRFIISSCRLMYKTEPSKYIQASTCKYCV